MGGSGRAVAVAGSVAPLFPFGTRGRTYRPTLPAISRLYPHVARGRTLSRRAPPPSSQLNAGLSKYATGNPPMVALYIQKMGCLMPIRIRNPVVTNEAAMLRASFDVGRFMVWASEVVDGGYSLSPPPRLSGFCRIAGMGPRPHAARCRMACY